MRLPSKRGIYREVQLSKEWALGYDLGTGMGLESSWHEERAWKGFNFPEESEERGQSGLEVLRDGAGELPAKTGCRSWTLRSRRCFECPRLGDFMLSPSLCGIS
jgi:hypothetical protein